MQKSSSSRNSPTPTPTPIPITKTSPKTRYDRERTTAINKVMTDTKLPDDVADMIQGMFSKEPSSHFRYGITLDDLNIPELALNPNVYPLIKVIIDKYGGIDELNKKGFSATNVYEKNDLIKFHRNLSKNEEPEVISYLLKIYKYYPTSISSILIDWKALCNNNGARSLLKLKIEDENKISREDYNFEPTHNKIDWGILSGILLKNQKSPLIRLVSDFIGKGNSSGKNIYLRNQRYIEQKQKDILLKRKKINEVSATDKDFWTDLSSGDITASKIKLLRKRIEFEKTQPFANRGINWDILCGNKSPIAIELVKERIEFEKTMSYFEVLFYKKEYKYGVSWAFLCSNTNPEAFKLLREQIENEKIQDNSTMYKAYLDIELEELYRLDVGNKEKERIIEYASKVISDYEQDHFIDRLDWFQLCANSSPEAVQLIKERIEYEKELTRNGELYKSKIDLRGLSLNQEPEAIELLMQQLKIKYGSSHLRLLHNQGISGIQQIIDNLSKNPSIIVRYDKIMKAQDKTRHARYLKEVDDITRMFSNIPTSIRAKLKST
jgi:hypothetical protein